MRKFALEYFQTQPGYCLAVAPVVRGKVRKMWLNGATLRDIAAALLSDAVAIDSVIRFKKYVLMVVDCPTIDDDETTRKILAGFLDYIEILYNELENIGPEWLAKLSEKESAALFAE